MVKFRATNPDITTNLAGSESYKQDDTLGFVSLLLTTFLQDKFYESGTDQMDRLVKYATTLDPLFVAKAAMYARKEHGIRSATHVIAAEVARRLKNTKDGWKIIHNLIHRPDDMLEILAYTRTKYGKGIPAILRKGIASKLEDFDAYQLAKYKAATSHYKMVDLFNLIHPKPNEKNKDTYAKLMKGELANTQTWEAKLSDAGNDADKKKESWNSLLIEKRLGYFALLRNLRNIVQDAPELIDIACQQLIDPSSIKHSMVMPFRFKTASDELLQIPGSQAQKVVQAIAQAANISVDNVPHWDGNTLIAVDASGSMTESTNKTRPIDIATLFAAAMFKKNDADILLFDSKATFINADKTMNVITMANSLLHVVTTKFGGGTDFNIIFNTNRRYDRIIVLSDMQAWVGGEVPNYNAYCLQQKVDVKIHHFDLAGHGTMQFPQKNIYCYAGFSDKIFDIMQFIESDKNALIKTINDIDIFEIKKKMHQRDERVTSLYSTVE